MRRSVKEAAVGFTLLAALAAGGGFWLWLQGVALSGRTWTFRISFPDATGLGERSAVTYRGVQVGSVRSLQAGSAAVVAEIEITDPSRLRCWGAMPWWRCWPRRERCPPACRAPVSLRATAR